MDTYSYRREREGSNPSFSSTLLDAIYRSIDEGDDEKLVLYRETMRKKVLHGRNLKGNVCFKDEEEMANFQRVCMIEKWMEKKEIINQKMVNVRRRCLADFVSKVNDYNPEVFFSNSSWSSSDSSSSNGGFSSSEAESVHGGVSSRSSTSCYGFQKPKPIRTSVSVEQEKSNKNKLGNQPDMKNKLGNQLNMYHHDYASEQKPKHEGKSAKTTTKSRPDEREKRNEIRISSKKKQGYGCHERSAKTTTKSRALKMIYGDLKKVKQPLSPGGKLASFLNSLFSAKKAKISTDHDQPNTERKVKSANASTCSSASSLSRSCLSKSTTPSSRTKSSNAMKRSVRFYPVSIIVDEDCQPCGHKNLYEEEKSSVVKGVKDVRTSINEELKFHAVEKNLQVDKAARGLLSNYQKRVELDYDLRTNRVKDQVLEHNGIDDDDDDEDDDDASYASSDLFELDNLSAIGMERYQEELPVYETTHLDTNRAIANGMIL